MTNVNDEILSRCQRQPRNLQVGHEATPGRTLVNVTTGDRMREEIS